MELKNLFRGYKHYNIDWLIGEFEKGTTLKYIHFWGHTPNDENQVGKECFSQWYFSPFTINNIIYETAEHWMMARKALLFNDAKIFQQIIHCKKPGEAKELGRKISGYDDAIWNSEKYNIVKLGNIHKFNQNKALKDFLLSSGERILVEASPVDNIWGIGISKDSEEITNLYAWPGLNLLGFALMEVRDLLLEFGNIADSNSWLSPPWIRFPGIDPYDMFWKMGEGEDYIIALGRQEEKMNEIAKLEYFLNNPAPYGWRDYYKDWEIDQTNQRS